MTSAMCGSTQLEAVSLSVVIAAGCGNLLVAQAIGAGRKLASDRPNARRFRDNRCGLDDSFRMVAHSETAPLPTTPRPAQGRLRRSAPRQTEALPCADFA